MGISKNLVKFDYEKMSITNTVKLPNDVFHIEKVNEDTFLVGEENRHIELINNNNFACLDFIKSLENGEIQKIENL